MYVNIIYYGKGRHGIYNASMGFFGVHPRDLNFEQATFLAGVPNAPGVFAHNQELRRTKKNASCESLGTPFWQLKKIRKNIF